MLYTFIALIVVSLFVSLILQWKCWRFIWQLNGLRGIVQQPLLWLLLILHLQPKSILSVVESWRHVFPRPLAIICGTRMLLYIDDPHTMEQVLTAHECLDKTFLQEGFFARKGLLHARGQQWRIRRKQLNPAFSHSIILSFFHIFNSVGNKLQCTFAEQLQGAAVRFKDVEDLLSRAVLEVSCQTTMGTKTDFSKQDAKGIASAYKKLLEISALRIIKPWLQNETLFRLLDHKNYKRYARCNKLVQQFVEEIVQRKHEAWLAEKLLAVARQTEAAVAVDCVEVSEEDTTRHHQHAVKKRNFIEQIFHLATMGEMTLADIMNETHAMILVSFETVSNSLIIALLLLAMHPDCQQKLRNEINEYFPRDSNDNGADAATTNIQRITVTQLQRMEYLEMVVNESLRLLTTVPMNLRHVSKDLRLYLPTNATTMAAPATNMPPPVGVVLVPQDTIVVIDTFNMQRDAKHWGPLAAQFMPERFAPAALESASRHSYAFIPFSKGLRTCIGWRYSEFLLKIFLVKLISSFEFRTQTQLAQLRCVQGISLKFQNADSITFQIRQVSEVRKGEV